MLERIRQFFAPPEGQDEETRRLQVILYVVLATVLLVSVVLGITNLFGGLGAVIYLSVIVFVVSVVLLGLTLRGHLMVARIAIPLMAYAAATYFVVTSGIRDEAAFIYPVMIALAGLLLGKHGILAFGSLSLLTVTAVGYGELGGLIETDFSNIVSVSGLVTIDAFLAFISVLLYLNIDSLNASIDRARRGAVELVERTRELEASQRVTLAATERVTPDELLDLVVNLIRDQFDLYHAQVYLVDEGEQAAVLRQSTGYAGRQLLQRKHRIPLDATALVTQAVHTGEPVLVDDVTRSPSFMANPLLPETRSELVVPLRREGRVIGVLDVQDRTPGRFSPSTIALFQTIADQTVILFENNALLEEVTRRTEALGLFTDQLRTSADIARRLATILDPDELLEEVVELLQSRFGLYHAHIYLLDEDAHMLRMQIGSGEVGRVLKERRHTIPLDAEQSLVAQAARSKASVLVSDTEQEPAFMPNPLLPQTRSELAIPLVVSDKVLGVLDLQANQPNRFTEVDRDTFRSLAGQVATSLQTAELFTQVQKTEAHFRTLFESANDAIFQMRGDRFIDCNAKTLEIYRCTREQIIGDSPVRFSPEYQPDGQDSISKAGARIMAALDGTPQTFYWQHTHYDGTPFDAEVSLNRVEVGGEVLVQAIVRDITERKQAEAERERFTLQLRTASDIAGQVSSILDPDELLNTVISLLKERFDLYYAHFYALDAAEGLLKLQAGYGEPGRVMLERGHAIPLDREQSLVARAARTHEAVVVHDVTQAPDFLPNPLLPDTKSEVAVPVISGGVVLGVFDVQHDQPDYFTEGDLSVFSTLAGQIATALENARLFAQVQEADKLKSEFLANMSHELRTPLNSIIGYSEIMLMGLSEGIDPETMNDVQAIYDNGQHLLRLINDVLDLAKIEAGRMTLELETVYVAPLLEEVLTSNAGLLVNKSLHVSAETEEGLPPIEADRVRLNQILNNLFSNAVKFTDTGEIRLRAFSEDGWCVIQVSDTGIGMNQADLNVIFERFRQVDGSAARTKEGTGLGLAITNHLIQLHGGTIEVQSELGKGSTFTIRLPMTV